MRLSVVTVTHDSADELRTLLASLDEHVPDAEVIVVDSASTDDASAVAVQAGAHLVELDANRGYGAANNVGVERATGDVVALLNPDVVLLDPGLLRLADAAAQRDALHVPRLLNADGSVQDSAHPLPGTTRQLARALVPGPLRRPGRVAWAIGAALVARATTLRSLGPFDPSAFLFYEDLDLCLRARAARIPTVLHPHVALRHAGAHSTAPAFGGEPVELLVARRRHVIGENLGGRALARDDFAQLLEHGARALRARDRAYVREIVRARRAAG
jgi:N-acetylglucosaminyl-diphospho-decaprenol L-rhamnosyltransferase